MIWELHKSERFSVLFPGTLFEDILIYVWFRNGEIKLETGRLTLFLDIHKGYVNGFYQGIFLDSLDACNISGSRMKGLEQFL